MFMRHATVTAYNPWAKTERCLVGEATRARADGAPRLCYCARCERERELLRTATPIVVKPAGNPRWWSAQWCGTISISEESPEHAVEKLRARMSAHAGKVSVLYYTRPRA